MCVAMRAQSEHILSRITIQHMYLYRKSQKSCDKMKHSSFVSQKPPVFDPKLYEIKNGHKTFASHCTVWWLSVRTQPYSHVHCTPAHALTTIAATIHITATSTQTHESRQKLYALAFKIQCVSDTKRRLLHSTHYVHKHTHTTAL